MFTKNASKAFAYNIYNDQESTFIGNAEITTIRGINLNETFAEIYPGNPGYNYALVSKMWTATPYSACTTLLDDSSIKYMQAEINSTSDTYADTTDMYGIVFGTGNTAPTIDDYKLSGDFVLRSRYNYTRTCEMIDDGEYISKRYLYTITNISDEPITIGEVGCFFSIKLYTSSARSDGSGYCYRVRTMIERTAFDAPITIEPDSVGQVTYTLRLAKYIS
jgi:hypothetical protein